jgi:hypothetical protein
MASYLERELARVQYCNARQLIRNEELEQKRAAAEVAERVAAAAAAAREAELAGTCATVVSSHCCHSSVSVMCGCEINKSCFLLW